MLEQMPAGQLLEWLAFYQLEPFGEEASAVRFAVLNSTVARASGIRAKPEDFLPRPRHQRATTPDQFEAILRAMKAVQDGNSS